MMDVQRGTASRLVDRLEYRPFAIRVLGGGEEDQLHGQRGKVVRRSLSWLYTLKSARLIVFFSFRLRADCELGMTSGKGARLPTQFSWAAGRPSTPRWTPRDVEVWIHAIDPRFNRFPDRRSKMCSPPQPPGVSPPDVGSVTRNSVRPGIEVRSTVPR